MQWTVEAPITFAYKVRETPDVLDPASDALLFGFIDDPETLRRAKARALKRVVVVDETVHALYGDRIEAYFEHHGVETRLLVLPTTEENKNMDLVLQIDRRRATQSSLHLSLNITADLGELAHHRYDVCNSSTAPGNISFPISRLIAPPPSLCGHGRVAG